MDNEPLNHNGPLAEEVVAAVAAYLENPIRCEDSGWPPVTHTDVHELNDIIAMILEAKFENDCDGDMVIQYATASRRAGTLYTIQAPHEIETDEDFERGLSSLMYMNSVVKSLTDRLHFEMNLRTQNRKAWRSIKPIAAMAIKLRQTGHKAAGERLKAWCDAFDAYGGKSLFIGTKDEVWEPLGVTCKELEGYRSDGRLRNEKMKEFLLKKAEEI